MATKRPRPVHQMTEAQFEAMFPDEEACKSYLVARRWPQGVYCPRCGNFKDFPVGQCPSSGSATNALPIKAIASLILLERSLRTRANRFGSGSKSST